MNLETINKWLDEECGCSYTRLEELHDFYFEKYCDLKQENKQLKERIEYLERGIEEYQKALDETMSEKMDIENNWNKLKKDLELVVDYGLGDESSKWDKIYGEYAKSTLKFMQEMEKKGSDNK